MELPKEKIKVTNQNPNRLVIYGSPKVGKTTILSKLDNCLIIDLENGSDYVEALKVKASNLKELKEIADEIAKNGYPYKYVAIDTVTKLEDWCEAEAKVEYMKTPMGANYKGNNVLTLPNGGGYLYLRIVMQKWLNFLSTLAPHVIFVGHLKSKMIANTKGEEVSASDIDLTGKLRNMVCADADAIGFCYRDKENQFHMSFATSEDVICGSRLPHLSGKNFILNDWKDIFIN
jgi:hypothetical protein